MRIQPTGAVVDDHEVVATAMHAREGNGHGHYRATSPVDRPRTRPNLNANLMPSLSRHEAVRRFISTTEGVKFPSLAPGAARPQVSGAGATANSRGDRKSTRLHSRHE